MKQLLFLFTVLFLYNCYRSKDLESTGDLNVSIFRDIKLLKANVGQIIHTGGFYKEGDVGAAQYEVKEFGKANDLTVIKLKNRRYAHLIMDIDSFVNVNQAGAFGLGNINDKRIIQKVLDFHSRVFIPKGIYKLGSEVYLTDNITIKGEDGTIIMGMISGFEFKSDLNKWNYGVRIHKQYTEAVEILDCSFNNQTIIFQDYPINAIPVKKLTIDNCSFYFGNDLENIPITTIQVHASFLKIMNSNFSLRGIDGAIKNDLGTDKAFIENNYFSGDLDEEIYDFYQYEGDVSFTNNNINISRGGIIRTKPNTDSEARLIKRNVYYEFSNNVITHTGDESSSLVYFSGLFNLKNYISNTQQFVKVIDNTFNLSTIYTALNFRGIYNVKCFGNKILGRKSNKYSVYLCGIQDLLFNDNTIDAGGIVAVATSSANAKKYKSSVLNGQWIFTDNVFNNRTRQPEFFHIKEQSGLKINISNNYFDYTNLIVNLRNGEYEKLEINNNKIVMQRPFSNARNHSLIKYENAKAIKMNKVGNDIK